VRRVFAKPVPLSKTERRRLHKLQARYDALCEKYQHDDEMPAKAAEQLGRIESAIEALRREENKARDIALAGAFVTLSGDGSVRIERGFVRTDDEPECKTKAEDQKKRPARHADGLAPFSEKLVAELTAYRPQ
jgi:ParB family chromosome partitioning protein